MEGHLTRFAWQALKAASVNGNVFLALGAVLCYGVSARMTEMKAKNIRRTLHLDALYFRFVAGIFRFISLMCVGVAGGNVVGMEMMTFKGQALTSLLVVAGLASQETLSNFAAALMLMIAGPFEVGDKVVMCGHTATVVSVGFFTTQLRSGDNEGIVIPNSMVTKHIILNKFNNFDKSEHQLRKAACDIYIKVDADLDEAVKALREAGDEVVEHVKGKHACPKKQMSTMQPDGLAKQKSTTLSEYYQERYHNESALTHQLTHTFPLLTWTKKHQVCADDKSCDTGVHCHALSKVTSAEVKTTVKVVGQDVASGLHLRLSTMCEGTIVGDIQELLFVTAVRKLRERKILMSGP